PRLWIGAEDRELGIQIVEKVKAGGSRPVVALSFGVGGNLDKRLADPFEERLLTRLLEEGYAVVLDQGAGEEERQRALRHVEAARLNGHSGGKWNAAATNESPREAPLMTWQGGIGAWGGVIAASDCFVGYDSSGQHIAAALGIPTIDIFPANTTSLFRERWK